MKRGTILLTIGLALVLFIAVATYYVGTMTLPMLGLGVAGLVLAGVGASQRWERASR
jgi:archaellum biogenesis protein FlaJ (TadC family)